MWYETADIQNSTNNALSKTRAIPSPTLFHNETITCIHLVTHHSKWVSYSNIKYAQNEWTGPWSRNTEFARPWIKTEYQNPTQIIEL